MTSTQVAKTTKAAVPALVQPQGPALEITAEDVALPRMYVGQYSSKAVKNKHIPVNAGDIFVAAGPEDPEPMILWEEGSDAPGPVIYVLGLKKGLSYSEPGSELEMWDYGDPAAHADAWITYQYMVAIPSIEPDMPFKWLLTKTGRPSAQKMNTTLKKNEGRGAAWDNAFEIKTAFRSNPKGDYYVPMVTAVPAVEEHVAIAGELAMQMAGTTADFGAPVDEPSI
jgi:hypothetical protein